MAGDQANIFEGPSGTIPIVNADGNVFEEVQVAGAAQTLFTLTSFQYTPGTKSIFVYRKSAGIGGQMLRRAVDYTETSATQITLAAGATAGDLLFFIAIAISQIAGPPVINGMPSGGTAGQVLSKTSGSDYAVAWTSIAALGTLLDAARVNIASASTVDLTPQAAVTRNIQITGTTQIDGFQITNGQLFAVKFQSALLLKNNASIVTQAGVDIQISAGDTCFIRATADNVVEIIGFSKASQGLVDPINDFRLTLAPGNPVPGIDVIGGTIYCTPYKGNKIALYSGGSWKLYQSAEFSLALAALTVARPYDIFAYDNAGAPTLEFLSWTNDTARATALVRQDGVLVKTGDPTRRYLGTFYTTAAATTEDSLAKRYLWNYYNRALRPMQVTESTDNWAYSTATWRQANNAAANQLNFVVGISEDAAVAHAMSVASNSTATKRSVDVGIGLDQTTAFSGLPGLMSVDNAGAVSATAVYFGIVPAGKHYLAWLEYGNGVDAQTWYGDSGVPLLIQTGITGQVFA